MSMERSIRLIAGTFILASLALMAQAYGTRRDSGRGEERYFDRPSAISLAPPENGG